MLISPSKVEQRLMHRRLKLSPQLFWTELLASLVEDGQQSPYGQGRESLPDHTRWVPADKPIQLHPVFDPPKYDLNRPSMPVQSADLFGIDPEQVRQDLNLLFGRYLHGLCPIPAPRIAVFSIGPIIAEANQSVFQDRVSGSVSVRIRCYFRHRATANRLRTNVSVQFCGEAIPRIGNPVVLVDRTIAAVKQVKIPARSLLRRISARILAFQSEKI